MDLFNSRRDDFSPALAGEESNQLFFTSTRNQAQGDEYSGITGSKPADIFWAQKDEKGKWGKPQSIDSELNSAFEEGACCFSSDGRTMYLTLCKSDPQYPRYAVIAASSRSDAAWSKPTELSIGKDTLFSYAHPAISPDGEWLYFVSDMPGGYGGLDIWRCRLLSNKEVGSVENLGEPINTAGDEMFPTFRPNGDLYFSSDGHPGLGGLDIFIAKTKTVGWTIEHPGFPLNSQGDDFGMTFEGRLNQGFFSSSRGDNRGLDHIYSFFNPEIVQTVKGWVYEQDGYELTAAQVYMVGNDGTNLKLSVRGDGSFTQEIKPGVDYVLLGTCKGYLNHQEQLRVEPVTESEEYVLQFPLANIAAPVLIENIFYDFDKATLRPESATALDELVKLLNENPNVTIELSAHTDYKGSDQYNERLSQRRAESVVNYLIEHGIAADRLTPKGYGEGKPKTIKKKVAERYAFLKAGDVLTEDFIAKLPEEQQEQCNQLNRRTEFTVLRTTYGMFDTEGKLIQRPQPKEEPQDSEESQSSELW
jgi:outer membrane protein OmpA-like peptidoglycan-associated protein